MATKQENEDIKELKKALEPIVALAPDLQAIVQERRDQEAFNRKAAQIGRAIVIIATGLGVIIGTIIAVSKLIVTLGK